MPPKRKAASRAPTAPVSRRIRRKKPVRPHHVMEQVPHEYKLFESMDPSTWVQEIGALSVLLEAPSRLYSSTDEKTEATNSSSQEECARDSTAFKNTSVVANSAEKQLLDEIEEADEFSLIIMDGKGRECRLVNGKLMPREQERLPAPPMEPSPAFVAPQQPNVIKKRRPKKAVVEAEPVASTAQEDNARQRLRRTLSAAFTPCRSIHIRAGIDERKNWLTTMVQKKEARLQQLRETSSPINFHLAMATSTPSSLLTPKRFTFAPPLLDLSMMEEEDDDMDQKKSSSKTKELVTSTRTVLQDIAQMEVDANRESRASVRTAVETTTSKEEDKENEEAAKTDEADVSVVSEAPSTPAIQPKRRRTSSGEQRRKRTSASVHSSVEERGDEEVATTAAELEVETLAECLDRSANISAGEAVSHQGGVSIATLDVETDYASTMLEEVLSRLHPDSRLSVTYQSRDGTLRPTAGGRRKDNTIALITTLEDGCKPFFLEDYSKDAGVDEFAELLHVCGQRSQGSWKSILPADVFKRVTKLGEGAYGEVFSTAYDGARVALKAIPFAPTGSSDIRINGEYLKASSAILPEVLCTRELCALENAYPSFSTTNFIRLVKANVVQGFYPKELVSAWEKYTKRKQSENDHPNEYDAEEQHYVVIALALGGKDLDSYALKSEDEAFSILLQTIFSLIVAENILEFEHRDLHAGNVLVMKHKEKHLKYVINGQALALKSYGVKTSLIDFTNSRMFKGGTVSFLNLENDEELFTQEGLYQYEIYRMMRKENRGDWKSFTPKTNCFWVHYLANELFVQKKWKGWELQRSEQLMEVFKHVLDVRRLAEFVESDAFFPFLEKYVMTDVVPVTN